MLGLEPADVPYAEPASPLSPYRPRPPFTNSIDARNNSRSFSYSAASARSLRTSKLVMQVMPTSWSDTTDTIRVRGIANVRRLIGQRRSK